MTHSISRAANARADAAVAFALDSGTAVSKHEQGQIDAALAKQQKPVTVLSGMGSGGSEVVALTVAGRGHHAAKTFFATGGFVFGNKPPLEWKEAPKRDRADPRANGIAAFELGQGAAPSASEQKDIDQALATGNTPQTLLSGLDLGQTELVGLTLKTQDGAEKTFIAKDSFTFGNKPPLEWIEVPSVT